MELLQDLSTLTDVQETVLKKFIPLSNYCIGHAVHESRCQNSNLTEIDLGIGVLTIKAEESSIRYKFIPSDELETILVESVAKGKSPILTKLEKNLQDKIERAYKELL